MRLCVSHVKLFLPVSHSTLPIISSWVKNLQSTLPLPIQPFPFGFHNLNVFESLNSFLRVMQIMMLRQARATLVTVSLLSLFLSLFYYTSNDTIRKSVWSVWQHSSNASAYVPIPAQCYDTTTTTSPSGSASAQVLNGLPTTRYRGATSLFYLR